MIAGHAPVGHEPSPLERRPLPGWVVHLAAISISLLPIAYLVLRGCVSASLWLDEILYYNFEGHPAARAVQIGRPSSLWQHLTGIFAYSDVQHVIHKLFDISGFHLGMQPELYLRLPSLACFAASVIVLYFFAERSSGDRLWACGVALAFGSTPLFLFYAFEARVYSAASLLIIAFLAVLVAVLEGATGRIVAMGAVLGILVAWAFSWDACLLAAVGILLPVIVWRHPGHWRTGAQVALLIGFGSLLIALQAVYVSSLRVLGHHLIPQLEPQPFQRVFLTTAYGPFLGILRGHPEYLLAALLAISLVRARGRLGWCISAASVLSLALSVILMMKVGFGVSPRHQTALYAGLFVGLALTRSGWITKVLLANLIGLNLVLLPAVAGRIFDKGNAKQISEVIASSGPRVPIVVQHSYGLGYADPLQSFALVFYVDRVRPAKPSTPILELPTHRDVRNVLVDRDYFTDATRRLDFFASSPVEQWVAFLKSLPGNALWLVAPINSVKGVRQERRYESALQEAGFSKVRGSAREFGGYPTTDLVLWKRRARTARGAEGAAP